MAKPVRRRKMRSKRARISPRRCDWSGAIGLEVGIKPPDQRAYALLCVAVQIGEGVELVHQPLCMDPTQRMSANGKLTGIIADDDHGAGSRGHECCPTVHPRSRCRLGLE